MKPAHLFLPILLFALQSCSIEGLTNDYKKLNEQQKEKIVALNNFPDAKEGFIYKINGAQLRAELAKHPKALVYTFTNGCTSEHCKPLMVYEAYAKRNGYDLFLVMNGYRELHSTLEQPVSSPLYAIDNDYYNSTYRNRYVTYFTNDMTGKPIREKEGEFLGDLFFFENGKLEKVLRDLPNG